MIVRPNLKKQINMKRQMAVINNSNYLPRRFGGLVIVLLLQASLFSNYDYHTVIFWIKIFICVALWGCSYRLKQKQQN